MKKHNSFVTALFVGVLTLGLASCNYQLVPEPNGNGSHGGGSETSDSIAAPASVTASQGNYRSVELNWTASKNAVQYQIFSAATPYDQFVQEGETVGKETSFTIDENAGITKYYMVKAVNYYGKISGGSKIVSGTTLDVPIITGINASEEGTCVEVNWWMGNCSEKTYANDIEYKISVYDKGKALVPGVEFTVPGTESSCTVTGLAPRSDYWFTVEAKKVGSDQKSEISDLTNAQTAHKVIPAAAENLKVTKGTDKNQIELSWILPDFVDYYDKGSRTYTLRPVYFIVERKLISEEDSAYTTLASYIGSTGAGIKFDCSNNSSNNPLVTVEANSEGNKLAQYPGYIPGSKLTYLDKTAVKGKQYTYRITSYTDDIGSEKISSENSIAVDMGWKLTAPEFKAYSSTEIDGDTITSVTVTFALDFEDFAQYFEENEIPYPYSYAISYQRTAFGAAGTQDQESLLYTASSIEELNSKTYVFDTPSEEVYQGYYAYTLYIYNSEAGNINTIPSEYMECVTAANKISVTDDATKIPEIKNFAILDGFKNKYELSWDVIEDAIYTVSWTDYENGEVAGSDSKILTAADYTVSGSTIKFTHSAESGNARLYTLNATKDGIPDTKVYGSISKTLGTAKPVMSAPAYKTITVSWPSVQMADAEYVIQASYQGGGSVVKDNYEITEEDGIVTCVINEPTGYNSIAKAGLPINFTVTAKNTVTGDSTSSVITVRTLGPALINTRTNSDDIQERTISVSWDKVEGATGYIIYRTKYNYNSSYTDWIFERADSYFYDAESETLKESGNDVPGARAKVVFKNNSFTLTDYDYDISDDTSAYERNQAQISWGLPFGYVVLPVNGGADDFSFGSDSNYLKITGGNADMTYTSAFTDKKTATYGYGLNVKAAKSESASAVRVEWSKPYVSGLIPTLYKMQYSKEENHDYGASWIVVNKDDLPANATSYEDVIPPEEINSAFVYAVQYQAPITSKFSASYRNNLLTVKDKRYDDDYAALNIPAECQNKGYLLSLSEFKAAYGGAGSKPGDTSYYQENVTWSKDWDYAERALGPDSFTVDIKNKNVSSTLTWTTVAEGNFNASTITITPKTGFEDTTVSKMLSNDGITLAPTGLTSGAKTDTTDILQVLRDAKHYYSISLTRGDITVRQADFESANGYEVYAYRQISPDELAKAAMLVNADAFYGTIYTKSMVTQDYVVYKEYTNDTPGATGSFWWKNGYDQISFKYDNYKHIFTTTPYSKDIISFLTLDKCSYTEKGSWNNNQNYKIRAIASEKTSKVSASNLVSITITSDIPLSSYRGTISFSTTDSTMYLRLSDEASNLILSKDLTSQAGVKKYNPMRIAGNAYAGQTSNTYWWN